MLSQQVQLEKYTLEKELERNEWVTCYRGRRKSDDRPVRITLVNPLFSGDEMLVWRFKQIVEQVAELEHPYILPTYPAEQEGALLYLVQDWIEAPSLAKVIANERAFSLERMHHIVRQVASALDYAHQHSVSHGDLSAGRIYLGADDRVWVADFGLNQALFGVNLAKQQYAGSSVESLAPERVRGQGPSRPADLYALGILCYQMLAKKPPFSGPPSAVVHAQAYKQPRALHLVNPGIPLTVSDTVGRMLSKGVELRYNTAAEFARALAVAGQNRQSSRNYDRLTPLFERERRQPPVKTVIYLWSTVIFILILSTLSVWIGYQLGRQQFFASPSFGQAGPTPLSPTTRPTHQLQVVPTLTPLPSVAPGQSILTLSDATPVNPGFASSSDSLLPARQPVSDTLSPVASSTPTPTPTVPPATRLLSQPSPTPVLPPSPAPAIPPGWGMFVFHNPTGYDLIVDLTGPTSASALVPPGRRHEFVLEAGSYLHIVHTLTGQWLDTTEGVFDLGPGQIVEKDYYTDYKPN